MFASTKSLNRIQRFIVTRRSFTPAFLGLLILSAVFVLSRLRAHLAFALAEISAEFSGDRYCNDHRRSLDRLREAATVAFAVKRYLVREVQLGRNLNDRDPLADITAKSLVPPTAAYSQGRHTFISDFGHIKVRYETDPICVEAVSFIHSRVGGPPVMARAFEDSDGVDRALVFISRRTDFVPMPPPFANLDELKKAGWLEHPISYVDISEEQDREITQWLGRLRESRKGVSLCQ